jgi:hypothetical protein
MPSVRWPLKRSETVASEEICSQLVPVADVHDVDCAHIPLNGQPAVRVADAQLGQIAR